MIKTIIGKEFPVKVIPLIKEARKTIFIVVYDWKWYPNQIGSSVQKFNNSLIISARKGIKIKVITNSPYVNKILSQLPVKVKRWTSRKTLHTKLILIDDKIAILGSHNYTMNAFTINYEVSVIIQDEQTLKRLLQYFENLWY